MTSRLDPRRGRWLLAAGAGAALAISGLRDARWLAAAGAVAVVAFHRGAPAALARTLRAVVPVTAGLTLASVAWLRLVQGGWPDAVPFAALALRTVVIAFVTFSVLARVDLLRSLAPFPTLSRLLVVTLAQIHALRLVQTESRDGLRSRLPRRPGPLDVLRNAGGITAALFALAARNARDISDALRARGF